MTYEFDVKFASMDGSRDDKVDKLMAAYSGLRVSRGSKGKTRVLCYQFQNKIDAATAHLALPKAKGFGTIVSLSPIFTTVRHVKLKGRTKEVAPFEQELSDLAHLDEMEAALKSMHDRICGVGMFLTENEAALGELGLDIRTDIYTKLGKAYSEHHKKSVS